MTGLSLLPAEIAQKGTDVEWEGFPCFWNIRRGYLGKSVRSCVSNDAGRDAVRVAEKSTFQQGQGRPSRSGTFFLGSAGAGRELLRFGRHVIVTAPSLSLVKLLPRLPLALQYFVDLYSYILDR